MDPRIVLLLVACASLSYAEVVKSVRCSDAKYNIPTDRCSVSEVRVTPCSKPSLCAVKKGRESSISFDFIPAFSVQNLTTMVYYDNGVSLDEFLGFGSKNGCDYTTCPAVEGTQQTYNYNLLVSKKFPKGTFPLVWKVWADNDVNDVCCFKIKIKLE